MASASVRTRHFLRLAGGLVSINPTFCPGCTIQGVFYTRLLDASFTHFQTLIIKIVNDVNFDITIEGFIADSESRTSFFTVLSILKMCSLFQ